MLGGRGDKKENVSCDYTHNYINKAFEFLRVCIRYQLMLTSKTLALLSSWFSHVLPPDKQQLTESRQNAELPGRSLLLCISH